MHYKASREFLGLQRILRSSTSIFESGFDSILWDLDSILGTSWSIYKFEIITEEHFLWDFESYSKCFWIWIKRDDFEINFENTKISSKSLEAEFQDFFSGNKISWLYFIFSRLFKTHFQNVL